MVMIDRVLLGLLVASIVFHALALRFDIVRIDESGGLRIDRLTGKVSICGVSVQRGAVCVPVKE